MPILAAPTPESAGTELLRAFETARQARRGALLGARSPMYVSLPWRRAYTTKTCPASQTCADTSDGCDETEPMAQTVGVRIEALARANGYASIKDFVNAVGVSYETFRKWKAGDAAPNRARQQKLSELLGCDASVFMHGVDPVAAQHQAGLETWPFERITPTEWRSLSVRWQAVIEDAAVEKLRMLRAESGTTPGKRLGNGA